MIVNDLNTVGVTLDPLEDHMPLIVDANRVVALQISAQLLESVRWRHEQIIETGCSINHGKLSFGWPCYSLELTNEAFIEQVLGTPVAKRLDHAALYRIPGRGGGLPELRKRFATEDGSDGAGWG